MGPFTALPEVGVKPLPWSIAQSTTVSKGIGVNIAGFVIDERLVPDHST